MTSDEQELLGSIVVGAVDHLAIMPDANVIALNPADFKLIQHATESSTPSILAAGQSLRVIEDPTVKPGSISFRQS